MNTDLLTIAEAQIAEKQYQEIQNLNEKIADLKKELEALHATFPSLKQAIQEWQEWERKEAENESCN